MATRKKFTTVSIPTNLFGRVEKEIEGTGFVSVSSYVTYVLREIVSGKAEKGEKEPFTQKDKERVRKRLKALGYI